MFHLAQSEQGETITMYNHAVGSPSIVDPLSWLLTREWFGETT